MPTVLRALASASPKGGQLHLTAVVTMADNGGSAGFLRKHYGTLPTGDVRRALAALANTDSPLLDLMTYRFHGGPLDTQSAGSIFLTSLEKVTGSFEKAIEAAATLLEVRGEVLPVTLDNVHLCARLSDGTEIHGETDIDIPKHDASLTIENVWLEPAAAINPKVTKAIAKADMIIIGPGDLYTSLIPNLLVVGVPEAIKQSKAKKVFICNLMTKYGETQHFAAEDFIKAIETYVPVDVTVFNTKKPSAKILVKYKQEKAEYVQPPKPGDKIILADVLAEDGFIRHDSGNKLADVLLAL